ncbi:MAG: ankyrin repeat domain-containing protein [Bacteroidota bacterium]
MHKILLSFFLFLIVGFSTVAQNIHFSACQGKMNRLDSMLNETKDINVRDNRGRTLLHFAIGCEQKEVFQYLMDKNIDFRLADNRGASPLSLAVRNNNPFFANALLKLHSREEISGDYGASLLERAVLSTNLPVVKQLIEMDVEINKANNRGNTPLEIAIRKDANDLTDLLTAAGADQSKVRKFNMKGTYLGQKSVGLKPEMFAPNVISTEDFEFGSVFNQALTEFYYTINVKGREEIRYSKLEKNQWTKPVTILSHERYGYNDPFLSPDENRLYFISKRAIDGKGPLKDYDIWYVEKAEDGWSEPINAGPAINTNSEEYYISFTNDGTMYFASDKVIPGQTGEKNHDIYYSKFVDGEFQEPIALGDAINTEHYEADVFVAPDESYLIFCGTRPDGLGRGDLYVSFKNPDGSWSASKNMGAPVNTKGHELCPYVTIDGKYLLYTSNGDIYWVSTDILDQYRK